MTAHGFRAMAATLLNEMGVWNPDAIERHSSRIWIRTRFAASMLVASIGRNAFG